MQRRRRSLYLPRSPSGESCTLFTLIDMKGKPMNRYEGAECPYCHQTLHADDEITVCPQCGAPYHRACAQKSGGCVLQELHADLCMSCGTCSYVCPAKRPLTPTVTLAKTFLKSQENRGKAYVCIGCRCRRNKDALCGCR